MKELHEILYVDRYSFNNTKNTLEFYFRIHTICIMANAQTILIGLWDLNVQCETNYTISKIGGQAVSVK